MLHSLLRSLLMAAVAAAAVLALAHLGMTRALGAHPFWETRVAWIGAPVGALVFIILSMVGLGRVPAVVGTAIFTILSYGLAYYGKTAFAASYAEDQLAGQFWYFGWIAVCVGATATLAAVAFKNKT